MAPANDFAQQLEGLQDTENYILVTGGAGYIGSHTVLELLNEGFKVIVVDNLVNSTQESLNRVLKLAPKGSELHFFKVDICNKADLEKVFADFKIDAVIHFAGLKAVNESISIPLRYYTNNITGTLILLECMDTVNCNNIVFSSSATVYGNPDGFEALDEAQSTGPINPYGQTKLMAEVIIEDFCNSKKVMNASILRYFNPIGAHESGIIGENPLLPPSNLLPCVTRAMLHENRPLHVYGDDYDTHDGTAVRDYIHVVDLARGHVAALEKLLQDSPGCMVLNMGNGRGYSVKEVVDHMHKVTGVAVPHILAARREGDAQYVVADPSKALKLLNWKPKHDLTAMCHSAWKWQSNNPQGYTTVDSAEHSR
ncbi:hypothetical protein HDV01_002580 [Terramyces sp. JEL0728]|nr:hypothetical protein HDV01_002580 [Terramyces sp. JEL0728]